MSDHATHPTVAHEILSDAADDAANEQHRAIADAEPAGTHAGEIPGKPRKSRGKPGGSPAVVPAAMPAVVPVGLPRGLSQEQGAGDGQGPDQGRLSGSTSDWALWWGTFREVAGARLQVWRCSEVGLNQGEPVVVMTVADARLRRLDDEATARRYLSDRFGPGRYRLTPRGESGAKLPGTQSLVTVIAEDHAMLPPSPHLPLPTPAVDHDTAIEIERLRLSAEMERERESRRERQREQREERRREREVDRERRRSEERVRRDEDERRRSERDTQTQTMLMHVLKEMASGRGSASSDPLVAAMLAKLGQPDPLVLKLLDTHGKREELTDFFKVQAESMRMASSLQTDSLKQVMLASQDVQAQLMRQAAEVAAQRGGGDWDGIGSALSATASIIAALRGQEFGRGADEPLLPAAPALSVATGRQLIARPLPVATPDESSPLTACLHGLRAMQTGDAPDTDDHLYTSLQHLPPLAAAALVRGDVQQIQQTLLPVVQRDQKLAQWLSAPGVGVWLAGCLERAQRLLASSTRPLSPRVSVSDGDAIV